MSEILFVTWDGGGNVPPATAIARELQSRGHAVRADVVEEPVGRRSPANGAA